tara:strand:- start:297 stop:503 length:207 start_codon:yes stop_codon:yes gene_type:complete
MSDIKKKIFSGFALGAVGLGSHLKEKPKSIRYLQKVIVLPKSSSKNKNKNIQIKVKPLKQKRVKNYTI